MTRPLPAWRQALLDREMCTAVALYGMPYTPQCAAAFYEEVTAWCDRAGSPMRVHGMKRNGRRGRVSKRVIAEQFSGVHSLELRSECSGAAAEGTGRSQEALWLPERPTEPEFGRALGTLWVPDALAELDSADFRDLARRLVTRCCAAYGIAYRRSRLMGPGYYAFAFVYETSAAPPPDADEDHLGAWLLALERATYESGELRWVYPLNYLNNAQLGAPIDGSSLRDWIAADPLRGTLTSVGSLTEWLVAEDSLGVIRAATERAELTYSRERFLRRLGH